jgi:hypothetical protein
MDDDTLEQALSAAVVCCILAAAGPQRSRVLANLYKDERVSRMASFSFLEKVFFERILQQDEVKRPPNPHQSRIVPELKICPLNDIILLYYFYLLFLLFLFINIKGMIL